MAALVINITNPSSGASVSNPLTVDGDLSADSTITGDLEVTCWLSGTAYSASTGVLATGGPWSGTWSVTFTQRIPDGDYTLCARATSTTAAGAVEASASDCIPITIVSVRSALKAYRKDRASTNARTTRKPGAPIGRKQGRKVRR